jgi:putative transposase
VGIWRTTKFCNIKGKEERKVLKIVSSKDTSRQCPSCEYIDQRNRKSGNEFECLQCGYREMADYVAARNIAAKAAVNQPIVTERDFNIYTYLPYI